MGPISPSSSHPYFMGNNDSSPAVQTFLATALLHKWPNGRLATFS